ncbi:MAG: DUF1905 domain-containing protein [Pseudomonadota bacterium]
MNETVCAILPLTRWQGERGTYHLFTFSGAEAETLATHAALHRLEFGRARGFGSVKLRAAIGDTRWNTSVFPQRQSSEWVLLVSKKVMKREGLEVGESVEVTLSL